LMGSTFASGSSFFSFFSSWCVILQPPFIHAADLNYTFR
jgi:hypothetical protein